jgi:tetratricopeptide (TPR) repeat protein
MTTPEVTPAEALRQIEVALMHSPGDGQLLAQQARCLLALGRRDDALIVATKARKAADQTAAALEGVAAFYALARREPLALEAYDRLLQLAPRDAGSLFNRAALRRFTGDLSGAESDYDAALQINPHDHEAYFNRSELRVQTLQHNHIAELQSLLGHGVSNWRGEVQLRYALAKEYEDLREHAQSWQQVAAGAALRRQNLTYDVRRDIQTVDWICQAFPSAQVSAGDSSRAPIFIVGLPRSGTTLVERILSSHSAVAAGGELDDFTLSLTEEVRAENSGLGSSRRELIERSAQLDFRALGERYLRRTCELARERAHFTDKLPLNYLYCGLIHRALPGARIIHVKRHPLAVCHAMYKTLFRQGYPFSYDLGEIAQYYLAYERLMQHWRSSLPGLIHELSYERLIGDQEGVTRSLLDFCGLKFEAGCLAFERNPAPAFTASASQVRRPLYQSSLTLWTHYADRLEPLRQQLAAGGVSLTPPHP